MKYVLLLIMTMLSVYSVSEEITNRRRIIEWWENRPLKRLGFWVALVLCLLTIYCTWRDDRASTLENEALNKSVTRSEGQLQQANSLIQSQTEQLHRRLAMCAFLLYIVGVCCLATVQCAVRVEAMGMRCVSCSLLMSAQKT